MNTCNGFAYYNLFVLFVTVDKVSSIDSPQARIDGEMPNIKQESGVDINGQFGLKLDQLVPFSFYKI